VGFFSVFRLRRWRESDKRQWLASPHTALQVGRHWNDSPATDDKATRLDDNGAVGASGEGLLDLKGNSKVGI